MKLLLVATLLVGSSISVWAQAQSTAQIQGTVQDSSGLAVPEAVIRVTQTATDMVRTATSGADGVYVLPNLPIGPYRLEVTKMGFSTYLQTGIVLQVATNPTVDVTLKVGAVSEQVQVDANASLVETQATGIGHVMENTRILELPLNGRIATDLIQLTPGAIMQGVAGAGGIPNTGQFVVAGGQAFGDAYFLDGGIYNNPWDSAFLPFPFPDALQEFKVETSSLTAQNGIHSGATVNAVTKSGTNEFHGDLFDFLRNGDLNARNFRAPTRDTLKRNQYGGVVGGPVKKDKLFFFFGYQGTRTRQDPANSPAFVPTQAMMAGDFSACPSAIAAAVASKFDPATHKLLDPTQLDPVALKLAAKLPPTNDPCGQTFFGLTTQINEGQFVGKGDYTINSRHSVFGRYTTYAFYRPPSYDFTPGNLLSTGQGGLNDRTQSYIFGDTFLISPTTVNQFRASVDRIAVHRFNSDFFSACDLGVPIYCGYLQHQSFFSVANQFTVGTPTGTSGLSHGTTYQLSDDITLVKGKHQLGFGVSGEAYKMVFYGTVYAQNMFNFGSLSQFVLGQFNNNAFSLPNTLLQYKWFGSAYAQDTWKVTPKLTVNLGLRWEPFLPPGSINNAAYNFSYPNFLAGVKTKQYLNAPPGLTFPGDAGFIGNSGLQSQWNLFAPRVGLAYDPTGTGKMTIRASYGISYDYVNGQLFVNTADAPPFGDTQIFAGQFSNPYANQPAGSNIFPYTVGPNAPFTPYGTFIAMRPNLKTTAVHQWNARIERQFGNDWVASATYIGSETEHLWVSYQTNPAVVSACPGGAAINTCNTTANQNQRRLFGNQQIGYMDVYDDGGTASYNGMVLALQKRFSKGLTVDTNYTWSHCIGDLAIGNSTGNAGAGLLYPNNRRFDRSNCHSSEIGGQFSSDRRQVFSLSLVYQTPHLANPMTNRLFSSWQIGGIYRKQTGPYLGLSLTSDVQLAANSAASQRPLQVLGNPLCADPGPSCWINKAAFQTPAFGTLSPMGRDNILGPGYFGLDAKLSREFKLHERQSLEVRGEAFNLTNSFRAGIAQPSLAAGGSGVVTTFGLPTFGTVTSALDPRIIQFALKFMF
ncbi:MAG: carboxypeptidase regulatory-like domain-containing protein [Acidobacteriia bacterium]|nr:carboxypeptidase regulatory-like domain-containing protein [Terriglobia bacterium]